jgi:transcriptional regulator with XRE-family HTH domain
MINGALIRAARGLLGWSGKTLAQRANIGTATLQRIEHASYVDCGQYGTIRKIRDVLMEEGVRFTDESGGDIGVVLTREKAWELQHRDFREGETGH